MERIFAVLMIITAAAMAFAHGSNDVANAIGPLAAIYSIIDSGGIVGSKSALPVWILFIGGLGIAFGHLLRLIYMCLFLNLYPLCQFQWFHQSSDISKRLQN